MNDEDNLLLGSLISDEQRLDFLNRRLLELHNERDLGYLKRNSRYINADIEKIEFERQIVLDKIHATKTSAKQLQINNSQIHLGGGDNIGHNKNTNNKSGWLDRFLYPLLVGVLVTVISLIISSHFN